MKIPPGVTVHKGGMIYREGDEWPADHPVPDHLREQPKPQPQPPKER
jgi:hypothetical protein